MLRIKKGLHKRKSLLNCQRVCSKTGGYVISLSGRWCRKFCLVFGNLFDGALLLRACSNFVWYSERHTLTRPDEAQDIVGSNCNAFRREAIFHGWISLYNVSSLSHSSDVNDSRISESRRQWVSWFQVEHVCSVLECTSQLSCVQGQLELSFTVHGQRCRVVLHAKRQIIN